jgi:glucose/arabinose dehydrogenase
MKKKSGSQSAFLNLRVLTGLFVFVSGISFAVFAAANEFNVSTPKAFSSRAVQQFNPSIKPSFSPFPVIQLQPVVTGLTMPVTVTNAGDGTGRLFIVEQEGQIRILINGTILPMPFLDISGLVSCCGEQGLLGLAFHPDYAANGFFYVD